VADYGVNINLRIKGQSGLDRLNSKVKELTKSVDDIRQIDIMNPRNTGGAGGKDARNELKKYRQDMDDVVKSVNKAKGAFGETANQQMAVSDSLEEYTNNLKIGTKRHKEALAATNKQNAAIGRETISINKNTDAQIKNNKAQAQGNKLDKFNNKSTGAALKSGLISGAFPLLFGQGPLGGAAGFAGGFVGTKMGGQMGGFAGGLVATALLQQLTTLFAKLNEIGGALDELNPDIDKLTDSLGLAGTAEGRRLKFIEEMEGAHVALALATEKMTEIVGEDGVQSLKEFAEGSELLGNSFKKSMLKIQVAAADLFNSLRKFLPGQKEAEANRTAELARLGGAGKDPFLQALIAEQKKIEEELKVIEKQNLDKTIKDQALGPLSFSSGGMFPSQIKQTAEQQINDNEQRNNLQKDLDKLTKEIKLREQNFAKIGKGVELDKERQDILDKGLKSITDQNTFLQNQLLLGKQGAEIEKLKKDLANEMGIAVSKFTDSQVEQIENAVKFRDELTKINELYSSIGSTIETGLVDAIEGAINGTKTLGDVARSVFTQIQRSLIQFGVNSFLGGLPGIGKMFRADGGPVKRGGSFIVGERGPELFTPGVSGMITPNHALGGSTNVVVNVNASGSSVEGDEQQGRQLGLAISAAVQSEILNQKRPGGLLA
tara:strand:- start:7107 stop:9089 length:1983 start_codon:yes stop_codon:yes gene_type:complete